MTHEKNILLVGLGNLGLHYIKSVSKLKFKTNLYYYDLNINLRNYIFKNTKFVNYHRIEDIKKFHKKMNLIIIATTANQRCELIESLIKNKAKFWIVEKLLEQNILSTNKIKKILQPYKCWINLPRRSMKEFKLIKKKLLELKKNSSIDLKHKMHGDRIVTNIIHFVDLMCWILNTKIKKVNVSKLNKNWTESKRKGFFDIGGKLIVTLKTNSKIILETKKTKTNSDIIIGNNYFFYRINEHAGKIISSKKKITKYSPPYVSIIMEKIITQILYFGRCNLPPLREVVGNHNILIKNLKLHWEFCNRKKIKNLPVT